MEEILHAAAEREGPQNFDEDEVMVAGDSGQNIPQAKIVAASVDVPVMMSAAALKKLKKDQLCHQITIRSVTFNKSKTGTSTEAATILACGMFCPDSPATITSSSSKSWGPSFSAAA